MPMQVTKDVIYELPTCCSLAPILAGGEERFLVAAEKDDPCVLFAADGTRLETVWEGPGGVMTMEQLPGPTSCFLATQRFFSPNDSAEAKIVLAEPGKDGWRVRTVAELPFVHRFGIISRNGTRHLLACTLKSGHERKDDWSHPGAVYAVALPETLDGVDAEHPLEFRLLKDGMTKNHGFSKCLDGSVEAALVASESGVWRFTPPTDPEGEWTIAQLLDVGASDAVLVDFDGDGEAELGVISPFHGDRLAIYARDGDGAYHEAWAYPEPLPFLHATWPGYLFGRPAWFVGARGGERLSLVITWDADAGTYRAEVFDRGAGAANFLQLDMRRLLAANRESDEVAIYTFSEDGE